MSQDELPLVHVRVTSNVDSMRRGWEGQLPLTERVEALSLAGYLQILGHVNLSAAAAPAAVVPLPVEEQVSPAGKMVLPETMEFLPVEPEPAKPKRPSRRRPPFNVEVDSGSSPSSP